MDKSKSAAERIRPILQAMERSIDAARAARTHQGRPVPPAPPAEIPEEDEPRPTGKVDPETASRMRARPKRPAPLPDERGPMRPRDREDGR